MSDTILQFIVLFNNSNILRCQIVDNSNNIKLIIETLLLIQQFRLFNII